VSNSISPNTIVGHYRILSKIGAGGMGDVYLAHDTKLDRKVALKVLPADVASNRDRMARFVREAKSAAALNHPNIAQVHEIGEHHGIHYIAMEFIKGLTLRQRLSSSRLNLSEVLDICLQVTTAMSTAHQAGIIHRDIKPDNIMIREDGIVKLLDFGLAKLTAHESRDVDAEAPTKAILKTDPGTVVGTPVYMSPEQARGIQVDERTDIFSVGVVLYEMVAGLLPFAGSSSSEVLASLLSEKEPQPLARYSRDVPAELERIVSKALRKNRDIRYQTIKDMQLDLQSLKQELEFERKLERSTPPNPEVTSRTEGQARDETLAAPARR
jgi:serine/threonine protein kinase